MANTPFFVKDYKEFCLTQITEKVKLQLNMDYKRSKFTNLQKGIVPLGGFIPAFSGYSFSRFPPGGLSYER
jgi:hypothetical protein